ncbi:MAG: hypothetical protein ABIG39_04505 [Candidatus Micrarchaeota archaeon]
MEAVLACMVFAVLVHLLHDIMFWRGSPIGYSVLWILICAMSAFGIANWFGVNFGTIFCLGMAFASFYFIFNMEKYCERRERNAGNMKRGSRKLKEAVKEVRDETKPRAARNGQPATQPSSGRN